MRRFFICLFFLVFCFTINAQQNEGQVKNDWIYAPAEVEAKPDFPGGLDEFHQFVKANFKVPKDESFKAGMVFVSFVVEPNGSLTDIKILRDLGHGTGDEAKRVLTEGPKWIPGQKDGKPVRVLYSIFMRAGEKKPRQ